MNGEPVEFEIGRPSAVHFDKPGSLFLVILDNVNRQSLPIAVIPDIFYRESILVFFRMDTCHRHAGMTNGRWIPAPGKNYRGKLTGTQV
jgi:hypothetical protein